MSMYHVTEKIDSELLVQDVHTVNHVLTVKFLLLYKFNNHFSDVQTTWTSWTT